MTHTSEIDRSPPRPAPVQRPLEDLDRVDRAILAMVKDPEYDGGLTPSCINSLLPRRYGIDGVGLANVGKRLTVLSRERRLMYIRKDNTRYVVPMPGEGWRGRESRGAPLDTHLSSSPRPGHDSPADVPIREGC
jgi:hypothetical protein